MDSIKEIDKYLEQLSRMSTEDMFPNSLYYPGQKVKTTNTININNTDNNTTDNSMMSSEGEGLINHSKYNGNVQNMTFSQGNTNNNLGTAFGGNFYEDKLNNNKDKGNRSKRPSRSSSVKSQREGTNNISKVKNNFKNITIDKYFHKADRNTNNNNKSKSVDKVDSGKDINMSLNQSAYYSSEMTNSYKIDEKSLITINFSESADDFVYRVYMKENLIIGCGGKYVKVYDLGVINSKKGNKNNLHTPEFTFTTESEEKFYALACQEAQVSKEKEISTILAVGGTKSIIYIYDLTRRVQRLQLIGHRQDIYDLKFCPLIEKSSLLLSASVDFTVRLWNIINGAQIAIFGGLNGHFSEVISVDWHLSGQYFLSSGIDYSVKIWEINEQIDENIRLSFLTKDKTELKKQHQFKTVIRSNPVFSCNSIHDNYIDCVKFNGNLVISKSVNGILYEYLPTFNDESDSVFILNTYCFKEVENVWYMNFDVDTLDKQVLGVGNTQGEFFLFSLLGESNNRNIGTMQDDYMFMSKPLSSVMTPCKKLIRSVYLDKTSDYFVLGHNEGKMTLGKLKRD